MVKLEGTTFSGIYKITTPKGKTYIGSSKNIKDRARKHSYLLRNNKHQNKKLQNAFNKYGELTLEPIYKCKPKDLAKWEQVFIDEIKPSLNILPLAYTSRGSKRSEEHNRRISELVRERLKKKKYRDILKKNHFTSENNPMKKGKWMPCHQAMAKPVVLRKKGQKMIQVRSLAEASRVIGASIGAIHRRLNGQVEGDLKGYRVSYH